MNCILLFLTCYVFLAKQTIMKYRICAQSALLTVILKLVGICTPDLLFTKMFVHVAERESTFRSLKVTARPIEYNLQTTIFLFIV